MMGLFDKIFKKKSELTPQEQCYRHNMYDMELSQYSPLPRYYYISGTKYDIDSPESVSKIPLCYTNFNINDEVWGIDAILREHVNRYYAHIPEGLKSSCYPKISDFEYSQYKTETNAERAMRLKQENEKQEYSKKIHSITKEDMNKFSISQYVMGDIIYDNNMAIMPIISSNRTNVLNDITEFNHYIPDALKLAKIKTHFIIPLNEIEFSPKEKKNGKETYTQYYTYFECTPYTKTGKNSKYPLILHYATKNLDAFEPDKNFFGRIYYMQDGSIGKAELINWIKHKCYVINFNLVGSTLAIKSITRNSNEGKVFLYKI